MRAAQELLALLFVLLVILIFGDAVLGVFGYGIPYVDWPRTAITGGLGTHYGFAIIAQMLVAALVAWLGNAVSDFE